MAVARIKLMALSLVSMLSMAVMPLSSAHALSTGTQAYGGGGSIHVRNSDGTNDKVLYNYDTGVYELFSVYLSQDGSRAAVGLFDGTGGRVVIVNTANNTVVRQIDSPSFLLLNDISPDGTKVLTTDGSGTAQTDIASGVATPLVVPAGVTLRSYTPDGLSIIGFQNNAGPSTVDVVSYLIATQAVTVVKAGVTSTSNASNIPQATSYDGTINYNASTGVCGDPIQSRIISTSGAGDAAFSTPTTDNRAVFSLDGTATLFVRASTPLTVSCSGGGGESPADVYMANRDGSGAVLAFNTVAFDWAGGSVASATVPATPVATVAGPSLAYTGESATTAIVAAAAFIIVSTGLFVLNRQRA